MALHNHDVHVAAALDPLGGLLGVQEFPATRLAMPAWWSGWADSGRCAWPGSKGPAVTVPGSPGIAAAGIRVVEVDRPDRQDRRRRASPIRWMRSAPPGPLSPAGRPACPRVGDGTVEAIRTLMVAKRTARSERIQTINQVRSLDLDRLPTICGPGSPHHSRRSTWSTEHASPRPRPGEHHPLRTLCCRPARAGAACRVPRRASSNASYAAPRPAASPPTPPASSPSTGVGPDTAALARSSPLATTPSGSAQRSRLGAPLRHRARSPPPRARSPATGSTAAVTARPTMPCGASCITRMGSDPRHP